MAACSVCGRYAGLQSIHLDCKQKVDAGASPDEVRAEVQREEAKLTNAGLYACTERLPKLAGWLFPILIVAGAAESVNLLGAKDDGFVIFSVVLGAVFGGFIAFLAYTWYRMQALLAKRISEYLDQH